MLKQSGFMWKSYGFTKFHMWGVFLTGGLVSGIGCLFLFLAIGKLALGQTDHLYVFLLASIAATLAAATVAIFSILMLLFYLGANKLGLLESAPKTRNS